MINTVEVASHCVCMDYDGNPADDCWGCYDDSKENLHHLIINWLGENDAPSGATVLVQGKGMNWTGDTGYAKCDANTILDTIRLERADYRIEFYQDRDNLTARRWSHDEPMGSAQFTFTIQKGE